MSFKKCIAGLIAMLFSCETIPVSPEFDATGLWSHTGIYVMDGTQYVAVTAFIVREGGVYESALTVTVGAQTLTICKEDGTWEAGQESVTFTSHNCLLYSQSLDALVAVECQPPSVYAIKDADTIGRDDIILKRGGKK